MRSVYRLIPLAAALLLPGLAQARAPASHGGVLDRSLSRHETERRLRSLRSEVHHLARCGQRPVVVFDIDDTLIKHRDGQQRAKRGAVAYVNSLAEAGATIVYLTARPAYKRQSTESLLRTQSFPVGRGATLLVNDSGLQDATAWKRSARPRIIQLGTPVAFFDNDYGHVRAYRDQYPTSHVFRLNTRSGRPDPGGAGLFEVIDHFFY